MLGAIAGDVIGSVFEYRRWKSVEFPLFSPESRFTDDSVLTCAVAAAILDGREYGEAIRDFGRRYPGRGYGGFFSRWLADPTMGPYNSWGNGSAMRVGPVGLAFDSAERVLVEAERSAVVTHNHPEGVRGAQAVALAVFLAAHDADKRTIRSEIERRLGYHLDRPVSEIRPRYHFDESCQGSVPESITCFLESENFERAVRLAVSLGGDADTMACIAGAIAEPSYGGVPPDVAAAVRSRLSPELVGIVDRFQARFGRGS